MTNEERAGWKVHINKLFKHIAHDIQKGVVNQKYTWHNVTVVTDNTQLLVSQNGELKSKLPFVALGSEAADYKDSGIVNNLTDVAGIATMSQQNKKLTSQETNTMKKAFSPENIASEAAATLHTVGAEIASSALTSAKMEAGENILLGMRNLVLKQAGFFGKIKFKLLPVALDVAVTALADVVSVELMPNSNKAKLARECLNLAMTKEVISTLPIKEFTETMTGGSALATVKSLIDAKNND